MRFCQSFMQALYRYIGPDVDVPAGDMGVGAREIGYLYGEYRRLKGAFENGVLTGKGFSYGGSRVRPEATGYGAVYYLENVLKHEGESIEGKTIACAGFGNVTWGICKKAAQLGAKVVTLSGPDGYIYDPDGVTTKEKIDYLVEMRSSGRNKVKDYADKFGVEFYPGEKPWGVKVDIIMPSAMQNDVHMEQAKKIVESGAKYYIEVANMPTTNDALKFLMEQPGIIVAPSKAVNAGGVATSALEMAQNSERLVWTEEEVDKQLHQIMNNIYQMSVDAAEKYGLGYNLVAGANIAGFQRVADAMMAPFLGSPRTPFLPVSLHFRVYRQPEADPPPFGGASAFSYVFLLQIPWGSLASSSVIFEGNQSLCQLVQRIEAHRTRRLPAVGGHPCRIAGKDIQRVIEFPIPQRYLGAEQRPHIGSVQLGPGLPPHPAGKEVLFLHARRQTFQ